MAEKIDSVLSLIDSGTWRSAVFTSFTLSLTYVESHVLPRLKRQKCQKLTIFADLAGYRDSLIEQKARGVGREYAVVPIKVAGGIFHPKLVHLCAAEGDADLLLVGSGNLTYSGHGGNIEVLEALRPDFHAQAFNQAADFFEELGSLPRATVADPMELLATADRLRDVASRGQTTQDVQFVHSLQRPGLYQFVEAARVAAPKWEELLVLSPYHHHKAAPVEELARALGIRKLQIGVSRRKGDTCPFPFDVAATFADVEPVGPVTAEAAGRGIHGKWLEVRSGSQALVLTGSFNATIKSLGSIDNVECGVLRRITADLQVDQWEPAPLPAYKRTDFPERSNDSSLCAFASLDADGEVTGRILGTPSARSWAGRLENAEGVVAEGPVESKPDGGFVWSLPIALNDLAAETLQLTLSSGTWVARGWVNATRVLSMSPSKRHLVQAMARLNSGAHDDEDMSYVLDVIAEEVNSLWVAQSAKGKVLDNSPAKSSPTETKLHDAPLTADAFAAWADPSAALPGFDDKNAAKSVEQDHHGWDLLRHILAALLALPKTRTEDKGAQKGRVPPRNRVEPVSPDDENVQKSQKAANDQLAKVTKKFSEALARGDKDWLKAKDEPTRQAIRFGQARLLCVWSTVVLRVRLLRLDERGRALEFHQWWLFRVCALNLSEERRDFLTELVCGVSAAYSLALHENPRAKDEITRTPAQLHRQLDRFFGGKLAPDQALLLAKRWLQTEAGTRLVDGEVEEAVCAMARTLAIPTERQILTRVFSDGLAPHEAAAQTILGDIRLAQVKSLLQAQTGFQIRHTLVNLHNLHACPGCCHTYMTGKPVKALDSDIAGKLRRHGFLKCPHCRHILVALET